MQIVSIILDFALIAVTLLAVQRAERAEARAVSAAKSIRCARGCENCAAPAGNGAENSAPAEMPVPDFERSVAAIMAYSGTRKPEERS